MRLKLLRFLFWFWVGSKGYYLWSRLWRLILERRYRGQTLSSYDEMAQLEEALGRMKWIEDPLKGMFDIISSPQKVESIYQSSITKGERACTGDCDEFAIYAADRIEDIRGRGRMNATPYFMTINWFDRDGKFHGHNVCAVDFGESWGHIGNWFGGKLQSGFKSHHHLAQWWATQDGGVLIAYALASPSLRRVKFLWTG